MEQYFTTGKTLVIDDQYDEAKPLLDALSKNQIPFLYTQGKPNSEFPLPNVDDAKSRYYNLIFLDLNLDFKFAGGISTQDEENTFKSTHALIFDTVVKNKNRSFLLVIWSNEEENYKEHFLKIFDNTEKYSTRKRPYKIISLTKKDFFTLEAASGKHVFIKGKENELRDKINTQLSDLEAFKLFCEWDRVVSQSVTDTIDDFMYLINDKQTEAEREFHLAEILTSISIAYSGKEGFLQLITNEEKTDAFFLAITQILNDDIDRNILNFRQNEFTSWKASNKKEVDEVLKNVNPNLINRKLLIFNPNKKNLTGSVYETNATPQFLTRIIKDCMQVEKAYKSVKDQFKLKYKKGFENESSKDSKSSAFLKYIESLCTPVEINITPLCDIVQDKFINYRIVTGFIAPEYLFDCIKSADLAFFAKSPTFSLDSKNYFIGIDLRSFSSCTGEEINRKHYLFSLRSNLINDIQIKLAAHVSRLGVLNL